MAYSDALKNWRTTLAGVVESAVLSVGAEQLFNLTWSQRAWVYGVALLRTLVSALAADARGGPKT